MQKQRTKLIINLFYNINKNICTYYIYIFEKNTRILNLIKVFSSSHNCLKATLFTAGSQNIYLKFLIHYQNPKLF